MNQKFVQDTEQENSWWPNIGIPGSEEYMLCVKVSGPEQAERVPWTESIPKYYLTHSHVQCRLMAWSRVPWSWKVLRTQYCLCTYTGNKFKEASTPGHVFGEPPVYTVALKTGPRKHTWNG